jgi:hypothetical protein
LAEERDGPVGPCAVAGYVLTGFDWLPGPAIRIALHELALVEHVSRKKDHIDGVVTAPRPLLPG